MGDLIHIKAVRIDNDALDSYATRGVELDRDVAMRVLAAVSRDVGELRHRGGEPNNAEADELDRIRKILNGALANS